LAFCTSTLADVELFHRTNEKQNVDLPGKLENSPSGTRRQLVALIGVSRSRKYRNCEVNGK